MATKAQVKALQQQLAQLQQRCADQEALRQELDEMAERQKTKEEELRSLSKGVTVVTSRDRKLRKYGGRDEEDFETWEADALAAISGPGMGDKEKCEFLYNKLEGDARREILCQGGIEQFSVQTLLGALREVFVKRGVASRLLTKFWAREQRPGESLVAYSHSLMELLEQLERADRSEVSDGDAMLRKKFQAGVSDANLRWELSRVLKDDSTKFVDLRKVALQWADQCHPRETEDPRRAKVHAVEASALEPVMDTMRQMQEAMALLTTQMAEQQRTILQLQGQTAAAQSPAPGFFPTQMPGSTRPGQGTLACFYCGKPGHYKRDCRKRQSDLARRLQSPQMATQQAQPAPAPQAPSQQTGAAEGQGFQ